MSEFDSSSAVFKSRAKKLASLLASGEERTKLWRVDELAAIFRHQMSAPILVDLGTFDPLTATRIRMQSEAQGLLLKSFADLFHHPSPPLELLELIKDFAKANLDHPDKRSAHSLTLSIGDLVCETLHWRILPPPAGARHYRYGHCERLPHHYTEILIPPPRG